MAEFVSFQVFVYNIFNMSITKEILKELWNTELNYKGMRINIFGIPRFKQYSPRNIRTTIDRLKRKGIIEKELAGIVLSKYGKEYVGRKTNSLKQFSKPENISKDKNINHPNRTSWKSINWTELSKSKYITLINDFRQVLDGQPFWGTPGNSWWNSWGRF